MNSGFPGSLPEFQGMFPDDAACAGWDVPVALDSFVRIYEAVISSPDGKRWLP